MIKQSPSQLEDPERCESRNIKIFKYLPIQDQFKSRIATLMSKISSTTFATKISDLKLSTAARLMCVSHSTNVSISSSINKTQIILSHSSPVSSFSTDDKILVASTFNNIKVWDLYSTKVIRTIQNQSADLLYFHPFADCFVSTTSTTIKIWDLRKSSPIQSYNIKQSNCVSITPDGRWLAAGLQSGIVDVWDITAGKRVFNVDGDQPVSNVMFSPKDLFMVKVHTDNRLDVIDLDDFKIVFYFNLDVFRCCTRRKN